MHRANGALAAAILALAAFGVLVAVRVLRWGWVIDARVAP